MTTLVTPGRHGNLEIENNAAERAIKPFVVGRTAIPPREKPPRGDHPMPLGHGPRCAGLYGCWYLTLIAQRARGIASTRSTSRPLAESRQYPAHAPLAHASAYDSTTRADRGPCAVASVLAPGGDATTSA